MKYIDLHVHSNLSDGTLSPHELVIHAEQSHLSAIALTDHDTVAGIDEAIHTAKILSSKGKQIEIISGVELSAAYANRDIHILGLFIDYRNEILIHTLDKIQKERTERNLNMIGRFNDVGIPMTYDDLCADEPNTIITRAHFARYLIEHHYVSNNQDAFEKYLGVHTPFYIKRNYMTLEHAVSLIKKVGGVAVLAHPLIYKFTLPQLEELISTLKDAGLTGLETFYSANTKYDEEIVRRLANKFGLVMTGGSDFHGSNKPDISLGSGRGNLAIPYSIIENLKARQKR